jgi:ABC-2 type transport system ATP-binding protein
MSRIKQFQDEGRTIVLVTHAAETVRQICSRAIVLDHGKMVIDDEPGKAIRVFREYLHGRADPALDAKTLSETPLTIGEVRVRHAHESSRRHLFVGECVTVEIDVATTFPVTDAVLDLELTDIEGRVLYHVDTDSLGERLEAIDGRSTIGVEIGNIGLLDGEFPINVKFVERSTGRMLDWKERAASIEMMNTTKANGTVALDVHIRR